MVRVEGNGFVLPDLLEIALSKRLQIIVYFSTFLFSSFDSIILIRMHTEYDPHFPKLLRLQSKANLSIFKLQFHYYYRRNFFLVIFFEKETTPKSGRWEHRIRTTI